MISFRNNDSCHICGKQKRSRKSEVDDQNVPKCSRRIKLVGYEKLDDRENGTTVLSI
jgi:hypothetical protein